MQGTLPATDTPCVVDGIEGDHQYWHAPNITRHLVCLRCGHGLHDINVTAYPHSTWRTASDGRWELVPCGPREF